MPANLTLHLSRPGVAFAADGGAQGAAVVMRGLQIVEYRMWRKAETAAPAVMGMALAGVTVAAVEAVAAHRGKGSPLALAENAGRVLAALDCHGYPALRPTPAEWRRAVLARTGGTSASLDEAVMAAVEGRRAVGYLGPMVVWGVTGWPAAGTVHLADAVAMGLYVQGGELRTAQDGRTVRGAIGSDGR